jgi:hypothetical protein
MIRTFHQGKPLATFLEKERKKIGNQIYKELEGDYDYRTSDKVVISTIKANDYRFFKNGELTPMQ